MASKLDPTQIIRAQHDDESAAQRTKLVDTEMEINVSAEDGDSVYAHKKMTIFKAEAGDVIDTSMATRMQCFPDVEYKVLIDGEEIASATSAGVVQLCVPEIKVEQSCVVILQG